MDILPWFWRYLETDDDANIIGVSEDAPEEAHAAFEKWQKEQESLRSQGIRV